MTVATGWALGIGAGIALAEHWEPWAGIVGGITFVGWMVWIGDFALTRWHRRRGSRKHLRADP
jgi:hypothetical protein